MNLKTCAACAAVLLPVLMSAPAMADTGKTYVAFSGGVLGPTEFEYDIPYGDVEVETEDGMAFSAAIGRRIGRHLRLEASATYLESDINEVRRRGGPVIQVYYPAGTIRSYGVGANAYFDFINRGPVRPYVGGGIGIASLDVNDGILTDAGAALTGRFVAGANFMLADNVSLFAEGRIDALASTVEYDTGWDEDEEPLGIGFAGAYAGLKLSF
jgi:opacity protein-like surface antigen